MFLYMWRHNNKTKQLPAGNRTKSQQNKIVFLSSGQSQYRQTKKKMTYRLCAADLDLILNGSTSLYEQPEKNIK